MTRFRWLAVLLLCHVATPLLSGQSYSSVVVFGDSLSDTGNVAHLTETQDGVRIPSPTSGYTDGSFTDGTDTLPPARNFSGVWVKQMAASLAAHPAVTNSLDGGTNYAFGFAYTGTGTSTLNFPSPITFTVQVENIGQQVTDYLTAHPTVPAGTLVVVWGGANDVINATSSADVSTAVANENTAIGRLITAGATDLLVVNLPPLGEIPRFNGSTTTSVPFNAASTAFNSGLKAALDAIPAASTLHIFQLDVFTLFNTVIAAPATYNLVNVTGSSQLDLTVNPDTYFFWDDLHPTTEVHHLIAEAALAAITPAVAPGVTATLATSTLTVAAGASGTDVVTVTPAGGYGGTVALACGTLPTNATNLSCAVAPTSVSFAGTTSAQTATVTLNTNGTTPAARIASASFLLLPMFGMGALCTLGRRKDREWPGLLLGMMGVATLGSLVALSGCGGHSSGSTAATTTPAGTYTVPITVTPSTGTASTLNISLVVQ